MSSFQGGPPSDNSWQNAIYHGFKNYRPRKALHPAMRDQARKIDSFVDAAYDELSTIRNEWNGILEDHTISLARRHMVIGVMGRLSVIMQICMNLGVIANMLEEQSYAVTPSAEASEVCELSYTYLPEDTRRGTVRIAVISDD